MDIHETPLPGVGVRHDFITREGRQIAVVSHHTGRRDLVVYDRDDPDATRELLALTQEEADDLGELLGSPRMAGPFGELQQRIEGLAIDWLRLRPESPFTGRPMGDTQARTRTGVSIVAIVRDEQALPSPRPDFVLEANDLIVVVGTPEGVTSLTEILG